MKINNNLNVYDDNENIEAKVIYKNAIIIFVFFTLISIILTIFFNNLYTMIIGYVIGSVLSVLLFRIIDKSINGSYYEDLGKVTKKIHRTHQVVYFISFLLLGFIFKDIWVVIGLSVGFLLIKISIFFLKDGEKYKKMN